MLSTEEPINLETRIVFWLELLIEPDVLVDEEPNVPLVLEDPYGVDVPPWEELELELSEVPPWSELEPELPIEPDELASLVELESEPRLDPELLDEPDEPEPDCACVLNTRPAAHSATMICFFIPD